MQQLTFEQLLDIAFFAIQAKKLSEKETKAKLVEIYTSIINLDNKYKKEIAIAWGLKDDA